MTVNEILNSVTMHKETQLQMSFKKTASLYHKTHLTYTNCMTISNSSGFVSITFQKYQIPPATGNAVLTQL